jgi:opacity protein-like surface antigen
LAVVFGLLAKPGSLSAQGLELSGGWAHSTGDLGLDGFHFGAAWRFTSNIGVAGQYDGVYDTSSIGNFEFTNVGALASKSHLQNFLIGPRYYFGAKQVGTTKGRNNTKKPVYLRPFGEALFGISHLKSTVQEGPAPAFTNSDSAFSWALGGGVDYQLDEHWAARGGLDLLRTHLNQAGQSRLRLVLGIAYTFGGVR